MTAFNKTLTGALSFTGALARSVAKKQTAALSFTGSLLKAQAVNKNAALTFTGALTKSRIRWIETPTGSTWGTYMSLYLDPGYGPQRTVSVGGGGTTVPGGSSGSTSAERSPIFHLRATGSMKVIPPVMPVYTGEGIRMSQQVRPTFTTPAIVSGRPLIPDYWVRPDSNIALNVGPGQIEMIPDPDPVTPTNPVPGGVTPAYTWTVKDLTPPGSSSYGLTLWKPHGGSGPQWKSTAEYHPRVIRTVLYGANDQYHTYTAGVHFDATELQHMWMDWGSNLSQPFSVVITAIIHYYPTRTYGHYLLDAGKPTPSGLADGSDHTFSEGLSYRSLMLYQYRTAVLATHTGADAVKNGKHVITRSDFAPRPKMFFAIFNGSASYIGAWDLRNKHIKRGTVDVHTHRNFVMGRRQNHVSDNLGAHMTVFEIRFYTQALGTAALNANFNQLAATWKFNKYHM